MVICLTWDTIHRQMRAVQLLDGISGEGYALKKRKTEGWLPAGAQVLLPRLTGVFMQPFYQGKIETEDNGDISGLDGSAVSEDLGG